MNYSELITGIVRTLGLTALVLLCFSMVIRKFPEGKRKGTAVGFLFAAAGILSMHDPVILAPGVFLDGRTALLAIAFPYGGVVGTLIAAGIIAAYRVGLGGIGTIPGVLSVVLVSLVSYLFTLIPLRRLPMGLKRSVLLGLAASSSLIWIVLLPTEIAASLFGGYSIYAIVAGNVATVVVLTAFLEREKNHVRLMRTLEHEAWVDPLTQLQNRRAFDKATIKAMRDSTLKAMPCSLIMIDIDHFKAINDKLGHDAGDLVLSKVATIIRNSVRASDVVVRYGGEEIVLLLVNTTSEVAFNLAERIRRRIEGTQFGPENASIQVTVSAGVASLIAPHTTMDMVVGAADKALYVAKSNGRNTVHVA